MRREAISQILHLYFLKHFFFSLSIITSIRLASGMNEMMRMGKRYTNKLKYHMETDG